MHLVGVHANEPNQGAQYSSLLYENMSIYEDNSQKLTIKDIKSLPLKGFKRINNKKQLFFNLLCILNVLSSRQHTSFVFSSSRKP